MVDEVNIRLRKKADWKYLFLNTLTENSRYKCKILTNEIYNKSKLRANTQELLRLYTLGPSKLKDNRKYPITDATELGR